MLSRDANQPTQEWRKKAEVFSGRPARPATTGHLTLKAKYTFNPESVNAS
jgi:hypothetical protein